MCCPWYRQGCVCPARPSNVRAGGARQAKEQAAVARRAAEDWTSNARSWCGSRSPGVVRRLHPSSACRFSMSPLWTQREAAQAWLPDRFAHVDGPACMAAEARADLQLKGLGHIPSELVAFLRHQSMLQPTYRNLTALVALRGSVDPGGACRLLPGHSLRGIRCKPSRWPRSKTPHSWTPSQLPRSGAGSNLPLRRDA